MPRVNASRLARYGGYLACWVLGACSFRDLDSLESGGDSGGVGAGGVGGSSAETGGGGAAASGGTAGLDSCAVGDTAVSCIPLRKDVPYYLHPSHVTGKCVDLPPGESESGTAIVQDDCDSGITQKFWLTEAAGDQFAIRSAWSGLCLQVTSASKQAEAAVIQAGCATEPQALWSIVVRDAGYSLVAKHSDLVLDVAGDSVPDNAAPLQQSEYNENADQKWSFEPTEGGTIALQAVAAAETYIALVDGEAHPVSGVASAERWKLVPGLADRQCFSFESADTPGRYLRHSLFLIWAAELTGEDAYADATFCLRDGLSAIEPDLRALESLNFPGCFVVYSGDAQVALASDDEDDSFHAKATWRFVGN